MFRTGGLVFAAAAALLAPASAWADGACLLCGASAPGAPGDIGAVGAADTRPQIEIDIVSGFNFRRFSVSGERGGEMLVDAARQSMPEVAAAGYALVGKVLIRGAPGAAVAVELPPSIVLTSRGGGRIDIRRIEDTLPASPHLDQNGRLEFSFSGPLVFPAGATPGDYRASFSVDAAYQ